MTEAQWLAAIDPVAMLALARDKASERKLRLFAVACCRRIAEHLTYPHSVAAVDLAERYADGGVSAEELLDAHYAADAHFSSTCVYGTSTGNQPARTAVAASAATRETLTHLHFLAFRYFGIESHAANADLLRDAVGNPFRPAAVDPAWRTSTVLPLARRMYETRDFSAMPILADALQDAGCGDDAVLNHCPSDRPHARGCWVVDLLTGRS